MAQHEDQNLKKMTKLEAHLEKVFQLNVNEAMTALLSTDKGRDFLWWLFEQTGINRNPFSPDPSIAAYNCGLLEAGQRLQAKCLEVNPAGFLEMIKERENGRRTSNRTDNAGTDNADNADGTYGDYDPDAGAEAD